MRDNKAIDWILKTPILGTILAPGQIIAGVVQTALKPKDAEVKKVAKEVFAQKSEAEAPLGTHKAEKIDTKTMRQKGVDNIWRGILSLFVPILGSIILIIVDAVKNKKPAENFPYQPEDLNTYLNLAVGGESKPLSLKSELIETANAHLILFKSLLDDNLNLALASDPHQNPQIYSNEGDISFSIIDSEQKVKNKITHERKIVVKLLMPVYRIQDTLPVIKNGKAISSGIPTDKYMKILAGFLKSSAIPLSSATKEFLTLEYENELDNYGKVTGRKFIKWEKVPNKRQFQATITLKVNK